MSDSVQTTPKKKGPGIGATFWAALSILLLLSICSAVILAVRLHDYTQTDDRTLSLQTNMDETLDVFALEYANETGEVTVSGADGEKVVAPGTSVDYTVRMRNTDKTAIDFDLVPQISFVSEYDIPIQVRLIDPDGNYVVGDEKTWAEIDELGEIEQKGTLLKGESIEYLFQWKWVFESGDDEYDTFLGNSSIQENIAVSVSFSVHATANTELAQNGGFFGAENQNNFGLLLAFVALVSASVLLFVYKFARKGGKTDSNG